MESSGKVEESAGAQLAHKHHVMRELRSDIALESAERVEGSVGAQLAREHRVIRELRADIASLEYENCDLKTQLQQLEDMCATLSEAARDAEARAQGEIDKTLTYRNEAARAVDVLFSCASEEHDNLETGWRQRALARIAAKSGLTVESDAKLKNISALEQSLDATTEKYVAEKRRREAAEQKARYETARRKKAEDACQGLIEEIQAHISKSLAARGHGLNAVGPFYSELARSTVRAPPSSSVVAELGLGGMLNQEAELLDYDSLDELDLGGLPSSSRLSSRRR